jgi:osmoprotectant transport system substrate-binding protein
MTRRTRGLLALLTATALLAGACGGDDDDDTSTDDGSSETTEGSESAAPPADGPAVSIGAQDFGESAILAEIYRQALDGAGIEADIQEVGGYRDLLFAAFESGDVNLAPDYVASQLEFLNDFSGEATSDVDETFALLEPRLEERGLVGLTPSEAVDTNAFVVTEETADELGLETLSDLAEAGDDLVLGGFQDCEENAFCLPGLERVYGVDLSANFTPLDPTVVGDTLESGDIDVGIITSTDGRIEEQGWVLLEDDQSMLAADNVFPTLTQELVDTYGDSLTTVLDDISGALTTDELTELNRLYDVEREDAEVIAGDWLEENELA